MNVLTQIAKSFMCLSKQSNSEDIILLLYKLLIELNAFLYMYNAYFMLFILGDEMFCKTMSCISFIFVNCFSFNSLSISNVFMSIKYNRLVDVINCFRLFAVKYFEMFCFLNDSLSSSIFDIKDDELSIHIYNYN